MAPRSSTAIAKYRSLCLGARLTIPPHILPLAIIAASPAPAFQGAAGRLLCAGFRFGSTSHHLATSSLGGAWAEISPPSAQLQHLERSRRPLCAGELMAVVDR